MWCAFCGMRVNIRKGVRFCIGCRADIQADIQLFLQLQDSGGGASHLLSSSRNGSNGSSNSGGNGNGSSNEWSNGSSQSWQNSRSSQSWSNGNNNNNHNGSGNSQLWSTARRGHSFSRDIHEGSPSTEESGGLSSLKRRRSPSNDSSRDSTKRVEVCVGSKMANFLCLDSMLCIVAFLDRGFAQWACLKSVCQSWRLASQSTEWVSLLQPKCGKTVDIKVVSSLLGLQILDVSLCEMDDERVQLLSKLTSLQKLDLGFCRRVTDSGISALSCLSLLQEIKMIRCKITAVGVRILIENCHALLSFIARHCKNISIPHLSRANVMQNLSLRDSEIQDEDVKNLLSFSNLTSLDLSGTLVSDSVLKSILPSSSPQTSSSFFTASSSSSAFLATPTTTNGLCHLQKLNISRCSLSDDCIEGILHITTLRHLKARDCNFTDRGISLLSGMTSLECLKILSEDSVVTSNSVRELSRLTLLKHLDISAVSVSDVACAYVLPALTLLEKLWLTGASITDESARFIAYLSRLQLLRLTACTNITDQSVRVFSRLTHLHTLDLGYTRVTDQSVREFSALVKLSSLDLTYCTAISDWGVEGFLTLSHLETLDLQHSSITDASFKVLGALPSLKSLQLSACSGVNGRSQSFNLLTGLTSLCLGWCVFDDSALHGFFLPHLQDLFMYSCLQITDNGLKDFSGLTSLTSLNLGRCSITDFGLTYLTSLTRLEALHLFETQVTDTGISYFTSLSKLSLLSLRDTAVTDVGIKVLSLLPQLAIER